MGFIGGCQSCWRRLRSFDPWGGADGIFQEELLALAAEKEKLEDFGEDAFANLRRSGVIGTFYRAGGTQKAECVLQFGQDLALAIHDKLLIVAVCAQMGILLIHIEIQFIAEGAVLLKGGQGIHRDVFAANGVPITGTPAVFIREFRCVPPKLRFSG